MNYGGSEFPFFRSSSQSCVRTHAPSSRAQSGLAREAVSITVRLFACPQRVRAFDLVSTSLTPGSLGRRGGETWVAGWGGGVSRGNGLSPTGFNDERCPPIRRGDSPRSTPPLITAPRRPGGAKSHFDLWLPLPRAFLFSSLPLYLPSSFTLPLFFCAPAVRARARAGGCPVCQLLFGRSAVLWP